MRTTPKATHHPSGPERRLRDRVNRQADVQQPTPHGGIQLRQDTPENRANSMPHEQLGDGPGPGPGLVAQHLLCVCLFCCVFWLGFSSVTSLKTTSFSLPQGKSKRCRPEPCINVPPERPLGLDRLVFCKKKRVIKNVAMHRPSLRRAPAAAGADGVVKGKGQRWENNPDDTSRMPALRVMRGAPSGARGEMQGGGGGAS